MNALIPELAAKWEAYNTDHEEYTGSYDKENDRSLLEETNTANSMNQNSSVYGKSDKADMCMDSVQKCSNVINNQKAVISNLQQQHQQLIERLQGMVSNLGPMTETVDVMEKAYAAAIEKLTGQETKLGNGLGFPFQAQVSWYQNAVSLLQSLNEYEVELVDNNAISIIFCIGDRKEKMTVIYNEDHTKFVSVQMDGECSIADIVEYTIPTQDLPMMVGEVQNRLKKQALRKKDIDGVVIQWPNSVWEDPTLRVALSSTTGVVQVTLQVSPEYPSAHAVIICKGVSVISGSHNQQKLATVLDTTNHFGDEIKGHTMAEFLSYLQTQCF